MANTLDTRAGERALNVLTGTVIAAVSLAFLYWARIVVIPFALAVFLAFLLSPLVMKLQRWGLRRVPAVVAVGVLAGAVLAGAFWLVASEMSGLIAQLPAYTGVVLDE